MDHSTLQGHFGLEGDLSPGEDGTMQTLQSLEADLNHFKFQLSPGLTETQQFQVLQMLHENKAAFSEQGELGFTEMTSHHINTGDAPPRGEKLRRYTLEELETQQVYIKDLLSKGVIEPSSSPWSSPMLLVRKPLGPDGKQEYRVVIDYRALNEVTVKDRTPLPKIQEMFETLNGCSWFSSMDAASGFFQVNLDLESRPKTAFTTKWGHYQWKVGPQGLCNMPATFQRLMQLVLTGHCLWEYAMAYIDDILVYSKTFDSHLQHVRDVLERVIRAGLKLKPSKCVFGARELKFLGHIIDSRGTRPNPATVQKALDMPSPTNIGELESLLGLVGYYQQYIPDYQTVVAPMNALRKKGVAFRWTGECEQGFDRVKAVLTSRPLLVYPDFDRIAEGDLLLVLQTDASDYAVGAVLVQRDPLTVPPIDHPIAYWSKSMDTHQKRYASYDKEALAVVLSVKHFKPYLVGRHFLLETDHQALRRLLLQIDLRTSRQVHWVEQLMEYDMDIMYRPGHRNANADCFSRVVGGKFVDETPEGLYKLVAVTTQTPKSWLQDNGNSTFSVLSVEVVPDTAAHEWESCSGHLPGEAVDDSLTGDPFVEFVYEVCAVTRSQRKALCEADPIVSIVSPSGEQDVEARDQGTKGCDASVNTEDTPGVDPLNDRVIDVDTQILQFEDITDDIGEHPQIGEHPAGEQPLTEPISPTPIIDELNHYIDAAHVGEGYTSQQLDIPIEQRKDPVLREYIEYLESKQACKEGMGRQVPVKKDLSDLTDRGYWLHEGVLLHTWAKTGGPHRMQPRLVDQVVIPMHLRGLIMAECHDCMTAGHLGFDKTYEKVRERCYWRDMYVHIQHYVASCLKCQQHKAKPSPQVPLKSIVVSRPFEKLGIDVVGPFTETQRGNKYIVVMTDYCTRWVEAFATQSHTAKVIAELLVLEMLPRHGAPRELLSDNGSEFCSQIVRAVCRLLDIHKEYATPYHPQCNGLTERQNGTLIAMLQVYCRTHASDWDFYLPLALMAYRTSKQRTLAATPFYSLYGREPHLPIDTLLGKRPSEVDYDETLEALHYNIASAHKCAADRLETRAEMYVAQGEALRKPLMFKVGDLVLMHRFLTQQGISPKLDGRRWHGPYKVLRVYPNGVTYDVEAVEWSVGMPKGKQVVHVARLHPYTARSRDMFPIADEVLRPLSHHVTAPEHVNYNHATDKVWVAEIDGNAPLFIECIVDERTTLEEKTKYLVKFKGYTVDSTNDWWYPHHVMEHNPRLLKRWEAIRPDYPDI